VVRNEHETEKEKQKLPLWVVMRVGEFVSFVLFFCTFFGTFLLWLENDRRMEE
jgi:hypothetical protein